MSAKSLLSIDDLEIEDAYKLIELANKFKEVTERKVPKVSALNSKLVITLFFEESTRTRISFELAAKKLSADVISFSAQSSSIKKGESFKDTLETIKEMGPDLLVLRHRSEGAALMAKSITNISVINAGDGKHEHPTQALLDLFTLTLRFGEDLGSVLKEKKVLIVGDVIHSRVARSVIKLFKLFGARVSLVGPCELVPNELGYLNIDEITTALDPLIGEADVIYLLRVQNERLEGDLCLHTQEYIRLYQLNSQRLLSLKDNCVIMHPGPVNVGIELSEDALNSKFSLISSQVALSVPVRMAVLYYLLRGYEK